MAPLKKSPAHVVPLGLHRSLRIGNRWDRPGRAPSSCGQNRPSRDDNQESAGHWDQRCSFPCWLRGRSFGCRRSHHLSFRNISPGRIRRSGSDLKLTWRFDIGNRQGDGYLLGGFEAWRITDGTTRANYHEPAPIGAEAATLRCVHFDMDREWLMGVDIDARRLQAQPIDLRSRGEPKPLRRGAVVGEQELTSLACVWRHRNLPARLCGSHSRTTPEKDCSNSFSHFLEFPFLTGSQYYQLGCKNSATSRPCLCETRHTARRPPFGTEARPVESRGAVRAFLRSATMWAIGLESVLLPRRWLRAATNSRKPQCRKLLFSGERSESRPPWALRNGGQRRT